MTTIIDAIYEGGLFRPTEKVELTEGARVQVLLSSGVKPRDPKEVAAILREIAALTPPTGEVEYTSRDHDKILYSREAHP